jgi:hypothetical protein
MLIEFKSGRIIYSDIKIFDAKKTIYICLGILGNKRHFVLILNNRKSYKCIEENGC